MSNPGIDYLYQQMHLIRHTESSLLELFSKGLLRGTVHTSIGQEACAVGVIESLDRDEDLIYSNHRCHGHFLSYCGDVKGLIAEIMGKEEGVCKGVGGSQHLQYRNFYSNGIQGAGLPVIAGMAFAEKLKKKTSVAVIFVGDGTFGEGSVYETLNIISLWSIPLLIVIENNRYAQTTPIELQLSGSFKARADAFDIRFSEADGMDVLDVMEKSRDCVTYVRTKTKPCILLLNTYRFAPHSKSDDFRDQAEIEVYKKRDPLVALKNKLSQELVDQIEQSNYDRINSVITQLINS